MKRSWVLAVSFVTGLVFALGLGLGGMTHPAKVIGFLDVTGSWDPSLAFVMGGAVLVNLAFFRLVLRRPHPLFDKRFRMPEQATVDAPLLLGAALFGVGWGLAGYCPGPAITSLALLHSDVLLFFVAMAGGAFAFRLYKRAQGAAV